MFENFISPNLWTPALAALSAALNPPRPLMVPNNFGGRALGFSSRLAGGFLGTAVGAYAAYFAGLDAPHAAPAPLAEEGQG